MLLNNFEFKEDTSERIHNTLPSNYRSWLEFYDAIPAEHREASVLRTTYQGAAYYEGGEKPKEYIIQREYLLARLAEELLPLRIPRVHYFGLRLLVRQSYAKGVEIPGYVWGMLNKSSVDSE